MESLLSDVLIFFQNNLILTILILIGISITAYQKPKIVFQLAVVVLLLGGVIFASTYFGEPLNTGVQQKDKLAYKSEKEMN